MPTLRITRKRQPLGINTTRNLIYSLSWSSQRLIHHNTNGMQPIETKTAVGHALSELAIEINDDIFNDLFA